MKYTIAIVLVVVSMVAAEVPRQSQIAQGTASAQQSAPYLARGWRPTGRPFNLPLKSTPNPVIKDVESVSTTTEEPISSTEEVTASANKAQQITKPEKLTENLEPDFEKMNLAQAPQIQQIQPPFQQPQFQPAQMVYVVHPQNRNFAFATPGPSQLVAVRGANLVATPARLQTPIVSPAVSSSVFTPFSTSFVQIYQ